MTLTAKYLENKLSQVSGIWYTAWSLFKELEKLYMVRDTILFKHISQLNLYFCIHLLCIVGMIEKAVFYAEYQSVAK